MVANQIKHLQPIQKKPMKNFSFEYTNLLPMKKYLLFTLVSLFFLYAKSQSISIASDLDSMQMPVYNDIFKFNEQKQTYFYIVVEDANPIQCNNFKVTAYFKDYTNGKPADSYWVPQGSFDFTITPNYYSYWMEMMAYNIGEYKIEVEGYLNKRYVKSYGYSEFTIYSEDDYWEYWGW